MTRVIATALLIWYSPTILAYVMAKYRDYDDSLTEKAKAARARSGAAHTRRN